MANPKIFDQEYLRDFFDHAPIGLHALGPDRIITDINAVELEMIGYQHGEIVGKKSWADLIIPQEKMVFEKHWRDINRVGAVHNIPYTLVHKDGHHVEVTLNASARFDASGSLIHTLGSVRDVTQHNQAERYLRSCELEILAQLQAEKKKIKDNVVHNVEHLIRPLLSKLRRKGTALDQRNIDLLTKSIDEIISQFGHQLVDQKWRLSRREIEICHMIKNGSTTKDIADLLCVSVRTIDNHRDHIRKKLNLGQAINLASYLKTLE